MHRQNQHQERNVEGRFNQQRGIYGRQSSPRPEQRGQGSQLEGSHSYEQSGFGREGVREGWNEDRNLNRGREGGWGGENRWGREGGYPSGGREGYSPREGQYGRHEGREGEFGGRTNDNYGMGERGIYGDRGDRSDHSDLDMNQGQGQWMNDRGRYDREELFHRNNYGMGERGNREFQNRSEGGGQRGQQSFEGGFRNQEFQGNRGESGGMGLGSMGRGPKGYKRSDERIREDVCDRIMSNRSIDASDVEIKVSNGEVTLTGTVKSRDLKRHLEDIAESVQGVDEVTNQIRVMRSGQQDLGEGRSPTTGASGTPGTPGTSQSEDERGTVGTRTKRN